MTSLLAENVKLRALAARAFSDLQTLNAAPDLRHDLWLALLEPVPPQVCMCVYCGFAITTENMAIEQVHAAMLAHDRTCDRNPLVLALRGLVNCPDYRDISTHEMRRARAALQGETT